MKKITLKVAQKFLIDKCNLSQRDADAQLSNLTLDDFLILKEFYQYGLRGDDIRSMKQHRDYAFYAYYHGHGNPKNRHLYDYNDFFGEDLDEAGLIGGFFNGCINDFSSIHRRSTQIALSKVKLEYSEKVFTNAIKNNKTPREALQECVHEFFLILDKHARNIQENIEEDEIRHEFANWAVSKSRDKFLRRHVQDNVRVNDIPSDMFPPPGKTDPPRPELMKTYNSLHLFAHVPVKEALAQINGLNADQIAILKKYYKLGVRSEMLTNCELSLRQFEARLSDTGMNPVAALKAMQPTENLESDSIGFMWNR